MTTIKDIAKKAGVSAATVSRIINGKGEAKPETIDLVTKIVAETGYKPNKIARSLRQRKSDLIAVLVPNLDNPFYGEIVKSIEHEAQQHGLNVYLCNTDDSRTKVEYFLENIVDNYVYEAVICTLQVLADDLSFLEKNGVHTVTVDRAYFEHPFSAVNIDQLNGAFIATRHLIERGARKIIFICGPKGEKMSTERTKGYRLALQSQDLEFNKVFYGDYTLSSGYKIVENIIAKGWDFDGIHVSNDLMAFGALRCCLDNGLKVPSKVKIVGNDDLELDNYSNPRLTSLSQLNKKVGRSLVNELINLKNKKYEPRKIVISPELIVRETT